MLHDFDAGQVLIARQPIFDSQQRVIAYELCYHQDSDLNSMMETDPDANSSSEVLLNAYTSICDQGEVKRVPAFIHLPVELVVSGGMPTLPTKQVVIQLNLSSAPLPELVKALKQLTSEGYRVALEIGSYKPELLPVLKLAKIIKLDISLLSREELREQADGLLSHRLTLLANKIETIEQLEHCIDAGFKLFEGSFLSRPKVIKGRRVSTNQVALMQLVQALQKPDAKPEQLEEMIIRDPVLTYKLLRIVNSAAYSLVRKVESVAEAVVLLGIDQVRKWATLISLTSNQDKPEELSRTLLIRGRMCELVAEGEKKTNPGSYFMAGMMSGLHVMLDIDQATMLEQVPLGEDIKEAITENKGDIGSVLNQVVAYESGEWEKLPPDFDVALYDTAYRSSLKWTKESMQAMYE